MLVGFGAIAALILGCTPTPSSSESAPPRDESQRPPLVVWLVDAPELAEPIEQLWQATSSQPIRVEVVQGNRYLERSDCPADVIVAPALDLAELADREWISPLPQNLTRLAGGPPGSPSSRRSPLASSSQPSGAAGGEAWDDLSDASSGVWPEAWQTAASYGRRMWGVPLGLPAWTLLVGQQPALEPQTTNGDDTPRPPAEYDLTLTWANLPVSPQPATMGPSMTAAEAGTGWLVERFLALLSQRTSGFSSLGVLLDMSDTQPRLDDPLVIKTAEELVALIHRHPLPFDESCAWLAPPDQAWQAVADGSLPWALAWPSPELGLDLAARQPDRDRLDGTDVLLRVHSLPPHAASVAPSAPPVAAAQAIVASIGFRTRQSAVAGFFLEWLNEPGQRRSLSRHSWRISPLPDASLEAGGSLERLEYRQFAAMSWQANLLRPELQLAGARRYRQLLGEALLAGISSPEQIPAAMQQCAQQWRELTEQLGVSKQRRSYERSLGLRS